MIDPKKLVPLKQWVCDACFGLIQNADKGYLNWKDTPDSVRLIHSHFRIVRKFGCQKEEYFGSMSLDEAMGADGLNVLLDMLSPGDWGSGEGKKYGIQVDDIDKFVHLIRRLHVPNYEAARLRFREAKDCGLLNQCSYRQDQLIEILNLPSLS